MGICRRRGNGVRLSARVDDSPALVSWAMRDGSRFFNMIFGPSAAIVSDAIDLFALVNDWYGDSL
jgi:hypothetical protein